ncbi:hypothetical protein TWF718_005307 [Orbilia javanica]|uniref:Nephrocystin 3-like N-terminal domain-containing protein n=1 Tax=Orbilia javanica TaxID=47235 RepID=A0AAN8N038_9PEZI
MSTQSTTGTQPGKPGAQRKTLEDCFADARGRLQNELAAKKEKRTAEMRQFLEAAVQVADIKKACENITAKEGEQKKFDQFIMTLDRVQSVVDGFISAAPESVSMVGAMTVTVREQIYSTCDSIATMIELCLRLEQRVLLYKHSSQTCPTVNDTNIWDFDIPELIFLILDFLWHAKPHTTSKGLKGYGRAMKETFTGTLDQKSTTLLSHYQTVIGKAQELYEDFLIQENILHQLQNEDIIKGVKVDISCVAKDLVDVVHLEILKAELDRQRGKIELSKPQEIHLKALDSRLDDITRQRQILQWLLTNEVYENWKSTSKSGGLLCIEAPRGHGKSVAMLRIYRDLQTHDKNITLRFFFKKGDHDIQETQTALETLLFQLLNHDNIRKDLEALEKIVAVLNPSFKPEEEQDMPDFSGRGGSTFFRDPATAAKSLRAIVSAIPNPVYLIVDALDECHDRREKGILSCFKSILTDNLRVIISARDTIKICSELQSTGFEFASTLQDPKTTNQSVASLIVIGSEENARDVREYLQDEVSRVLGRLLDPKKTYFSSKVTQVVQNIYKKTDGDFTRARLIITHLQQPSKLPLEKKVDTLPDSIGDIYMSSLEALSPNQQELVVTALKWIVWGVAAIHVTEISDHYREVYSNPQQGGDSIPAGRSEPPDSNPIYDFGNALPYTEENLAPEVKEVIYHLCNGGRDFFRYDPITGLVTVDISIGEWITKDSVNKISAGTSPAAHGFDRYRDDNGFTVFKFTLNPSFVKYGDIIAPLFNEREAQIDITLKILRNLNDKTFQERYMPWRPRWFTRLNEESKGQSRARYRTRYEIDHWYRHLIIVQKWWTEDSINDPQWFELLKELGRFLEPENWYRWNIQGVQSGQLWPDSVGKVEEPYWHRSARLRSEAGNTRYLSLFERYLAKPIHFASQYGLNLVLDYLLARDTSHSRQFAQSFDREFETPQYLKQKFEALWAVYLHLREGYPWFKGLVKPDVEMLSLLGPEESFQFLNFALWFNGEGWLSSYEKRFKATWEPVARYLLSRWGTDFRTFWFASQEENKLKSIQTLLDEDEKIISRQLRNEYSNNPQDLWVAWAKKLELKNQGRSSKNCIYDEPDGWGRVPLYIGALNTKTRNHLMRRGADINAGLKDGPRSIVMRLLRMASVVSEEEVPRVLQAVRDLLAAGAKIQSSNLNRGVTALHCAARIQDLGIFRQLCQMNTWDTLVTDQSRDTPMHYLFSKRPPDSKISEAYEIFMILIRMSPDPSAVVNAQNDKSESPLACAVRNGFVEGIGWLVDQKVDVQDDNLRGQNCFHLLSNYKGGEEGPRFGRRRPDSRVEGTSLAMARSLVGLGIDWKKRDNEGETPLYRALTQENLVVARFLVELYNHESPGVWKKGDLWPDDCPEIPHLFIDIHPYSQELFEQVAAIDGRKVDFQKRSKLWPHSTVLYDAIDYYNFEYARHILSTGAYVCGANDEGYNEVDRCCRTLMDVYEKRGPKDVPEDSPIKLRTLLGLLFKYCSGDAIWSLRYPIFKPDNPYLSEQEQLEIISLLDLEFIDTHGWRLTDILRTIGGNLSHLKIQTRRPNVTLDGQKVPTKIRPRKLCEGECSHDSIDGLNFSLDRTKLEQYDSKQSLFLSNHPITPRKRTTYFEVTFTLVKEEAFRKRKGHFWGAERNLDPFFSVGVNSGQRRAHDGRKTPTRVHCDSNGSVQSIFEEDHEPRVYVQSWTSDDDIKLEKEPKFGISTSEEKIHHVIGCGVNPLGGKLFFTVNGEILPQTFPGFQTQQFFVVCIREYERWIEQFTVNFGATDFMFEEANEANWSWDGEVPKGAGLRVFRWDKTVSSDDYDLTFHYNRGRPDD